MIGALLCALALQTAETVPVPRLAPERPEPDPLSYLRDFEDELERVAEHPRTVGLAVAILENGEPVYVYTGGEVRKGSNQEVTRETLFRAASVTKTFTGTFVAMLEEQGLVDLDQAVPESVLELKADRQPTWRELITHQTGLVSNAYDTLIEDGRSADYARDRLAGVDLLCALGSCYTYQNVAFSAIEALVEETTAMNFETAMHTYLLGPLGLDNAGFGGEHLAASDNWARPHRGRAGRVGGASSHYDDLPSAASLAVSLDDMIGWAQALLNEDSALDRAVVERAFTPQTDTLRETRNLRRLNRVRESDYAYGWRVYNWANEETLIAHGGALSGYGSQIVLEPDSGFAFIALWNADLGLVRSLWPTAVEMRFETGEAPFVEDTLERMARAR